MVVSGNRVLWSHPWCESVFSDNIWWCAHCLHFHGRSDIRMTSIWNTIHDCRYRESDANYTHIQARHCSDRTHSTAASINENKKENGETKLSMRYWFWLKLIFRRLNLICSLTSLILFFFNNFCAAVFVANGCTTSITTSFSSYARMLKSCVASFQSYVVPFVRSDSLPQIR